MKYFWQRKGLIYSNNCIFPTSSLLQGLNVKGTKKSVMDIKISLIEMNWSLLNAFYFQLYSNDWVILNANYL